MHLYAVLLVLWVVAKLVHDAEAQERLLAEHRITNKHLRKIREQAAWNRIRARFFAEHGNDDRGVCRSLRPAARLDQELVPRS